ncbi:MAG: hypothetical protein M3Q22_06295 [Actinomycetota bacterium]|nr:hypothetical protein [Actinomycetota bacterium]
MRLVASSDPGAVERFTAWRLLQERVVLTTAVCRELQRTDGVGPYGRADAALSLLYRWIAQHFPTDPDVGVHPEDGIEEMIVPDGAEDLVDELRTGTRVCQAFRHAAHGRPAQRVRGRPGRDPAAPCGLFVLKAAYSAAIASAERETDGVPSPTGHDVSAREVDLRLPALRSPPVELGEHLCPLSRPPRRPGEPADRLRRLRQLLRELLLGVVQQVDISPVEEVRRVARGQHGDAVEEELERPAGGIMRVSRWWSVSRQPARLTPRPPRPPPGPHQHRLATHGPVERRSEGARVVPTFNPRLDLGAETGFDWPVVLLEGTGPAWTGRPVVQLAGGVDPATADRAG